MANARCPEGHPSDSSDYCDVCGTPMNQPPGASEAAVDATAPKPAGVKCPNCSVLNPAEALFCEACGYDYTTGTMPRPPEAGYLDLDAPLPPAASLRPEPDVTRQRPEEHGPGDRVQGQPELLTSGQDGRAAGGPERGQPDSETPAGVDSAAPAQPGSAAPAQAVNALPAEPGGAAASSDAHELSESAPAQGHPESHTGDTPGAEAVPGHVSGTPATQSPTAASPAGFLPNAASTGSFDWVAEVWVDPDWYQLQQSPDPLPSPGLPTIVPLRSRSILIGRTSHRRNIHPGIDCEPDTGISRRQATLSTDGTRWYIEDLESANGTFVADAAGPLPADPIPTGQRHELDSDDRIYIGAWTRLVLRRATPEELEAFG